MDINTYVVKSGGCVKVARRLKVSHQAVWNWANCKQMPSPTNMRKIREVSRGRVSYNDMVIAFLKKNSRKKN